MSILLIIVFVIFVFVNIFKKRIRIKIQTFEEQLKANGYSICLKIWGSFRGADYKFGNIKNDGVLFLTKNELFFVPYMFTKNINIPINEINSIEICDSFKGAKRYNVKVFVLYMKDKNRMGFFVKDEDNFMNFMSNNNIPIKY